MLNYFRFPLFFLVDILLTLCAFIGIVLVSILLLFFYCLYRFIWLFSGAAAIARHKQRFKQRQNRLLLSAKKQRSDYSMHADRQDICKLISHNWILKWSTNFTTCSVVAYKVLILIKPCIFMLLSPELTATY